MKLTFRKLIIYITLILLSTYFLSYQRFIFSDQYAVRKWIWYLLGIAIITFIFSYKAFKSIFEQKDKKTIKPGIIFSLLGCFIVVAPIFSRVYPQMNLNDAKRIYNRNAVRFKQITSMRKSVMAVNECARCIFDNPRSGFYKACDSSINNRHSDFVLKDEAADTIESMMSDLDIRNITFEEDKVLFYFDFFGSPEIIMLDAPTARNTQNMVRINKHYFLKR